MRDHFEILPLVHSKSFLLQVLSLILHFQNREEEG